MLALALSVSLLGQAPGAHLLDAPVDVDRMTLPELEAERLRLLELRKSKAGPLAVMLGVPLLAYGAAAMLPTVLIAMGNSTLMIVAWVVSSIVAAAGLAVGLVWLINVLHVNSRLKEEIDHVDQLLHAAQRAPVAPPLPEPPLPVPGVQAPGFVPRLLLARF